MENWVVLEECPDYKISDKGNVWSIRFNRLLKPTMDRYGYLYVWIHYIDRHKCAKIHRLVAKAFLPDYSDDLQVNHIDNDKTNNQVSNLEMCTNKYNCNYGTRKVALSKSVIQETLDGEFVREWGSTREIERILGFSNTSISSCCRGYIKDYHSGNTYPVHQAYGYKWKYK